MKQTIQIIMYRQKIISLCKHTYPLTALIVGSLGDDFLQNIPIPSFGADLWTQKPPQGCGQLLNVVVVHVQNQEPPGFDDGKKGSGFLRAPLLLS